MLSCIALGACGSRTGFLDGDGLSLPDDDATGDAGSAGSGGSAGAGGLGLGGGSMVGAGGSAGQPPPDLDPPSPPAVEQGCRNGGRFDGDVVIFGAGDFTQLAGCRELRGNLTIQAPVADLGPLSQLQEVSGALTIVRGPRSLDGLQNLEQVRLLRLESIQASSLQPLARLQRVRSLEVLGDVPQGNLVGLGGLLALRELKIENSSLPSLAGLTVAPRMTSIIILNSATADLGALASVTEVTRDLLLSNVRGLTALDALSFLSSVGALQLSANPDLVQIDGLTRLVEADQLAFSDNPRLEHLPAFAGIAVGDYVGIERNAVLRNVPLFGGVRSIVQLVIQGNPALERVAIEPAGSTLGTNAPSSIVIAENQTLTEISVSALQSARTLVIAANPVLTSVDFPSLQAVSDRLDVIMNPALQSGSLGTLLTASTSQRKVGGNQGDTPLASCPYTNDDRCDQDSSVCAAGSDLVDCSNGFPPW